VTNFQFDCLAVGLVIATVFNSLGHLGTHMRLTRINGEKSEGLYKMIGHRFRRSDDNFKGPLL